MESAGRNNKQKFEHIRLKLSGNEHFTKLHVQALIPCDLFTISVAISHCNRFGNISFTDNLLASYILLGRKFNGYYTGIVLAGILYLLLCISVLLIHVCMHTR